MVQIGIVGTASWGTTLGIILARRGQKVSLWARTPEEAQALSAARENRRFLPDVPFPPGLDCTADLQQALGTAEMIIFAVPARSLRENARTAVPFLRRWTIILSAAKGLEKETGKRMSQVLKEELPDELHGRIAVLSGPNLSAEIARGKPASTVVAAHHEETARAAQQILTSLTFRVYTNPDVLGVELAGALKNIIALGAGICDGLGYGANAKAAFVTRGLAEVTRLGVASGANPLTFAGLAGLGDLMATCFSPLSRNRSVGEQLGKGKPLGEVLASLGHVAEGVDTTSAALGLARPLGIEMPITLMTHRVLFEGLSPSEAAVELMGRAPGPEWPAQLTEKPSSDA